MGKDICILPCHWNCNGLLDKQNKNLLLSWNLYMYKINYWMMLFFQIHSTCIWLWILNILFASDIPKNEKYYPPFLSCPVVSFYWRSIGRFLFTQRMLMSHVCNCFVQGHWNVLCSRSWTKYERSFDMFKVTGRINVEIFF